MTSTSEEKRGVTSPQTVFIVKSPITKIASANEEENIQTLSKF
jgi:hypothetical protein